MVIREQALKLAEQHDFVVVPCREKYAKGLSGWQTLTKSYEGKLWDLATGFGIGATSCITVIDVDAPDRELLEVLDLLVTRPNHNRGDPKRRATSVLQVRPQDENND